MEFRNEEDIEFEAANVVLNENIKTYEGIHLSADNTLQLESHRLHSNDIPLYWTRNIIFDKFSLSVRTLAYGGTNNSGRKLFDASVTFAKWIQKHHDLFENKHVLEIGCGSTGIPGIIALIVGSTHVVFLDRDPHALTELHANINLNKHTITSTSEHDSNKILDTMYQFKIGSWCDCADFIEYRHYFDIIVGSEVVYDGCDKYELAIAIDFMLKDTGVFILCQAKNGRGGLEEFMSVMTTRLGFVYSHVSDNEILQISSACNVRDCEVNTICNEIDLENEKLTFILFRRNMF
jgi:hypothetical protein